jgi:hypothetical protein
MSLTVATDLDQELKILQNNNLNLKLITFIFIP